MLAHGTGAVNYCVVFCSCSRSASKDSTDLKLITNCEVGTAVSSFAPSRSPSLPDIGNLRSSIVVFHWRGVAALARP